MACRATLPRSWRRARFTCQFAGPGGLPVRAGLSLPGRPPPRKVEPPAGGTTLRGGGRSGCLWCASGGASCCPECRGSGAEPRPPEACLCGHMSAPWAPFPERAAGLADLAEGSGHAALCAAGSGNPRPGRRFRPCGVRGPAEGTGATRGAQRRALDPKEGNSADEEGERRVRMTLTPSENLRAFQSPSCVQSSRERPTSMTGRSAGQAIFCREAQAHR